ncbi:hypothetical protein SPRG_17781, partial [Saprolegnia parasitica CBS 223.65]
AAAKVCKSANECPARACYSTTCGTSGYCEYTPLGVGAKCPGQSCTNGGACDDDANDYCNAKAECVSAYKPARTKCPGKSCSNGGSCDDDANDYCDDLGTCVTEVCSGTASTCPVDAFKSSSMTCTGTNNGSPCDGQDMCDGFGNCVDKYLPSTTVCRASKGQCDEAEMCSGTASACPADFNPCDGVDKCDGKGNCVDIYLPSTTVCRASKSQCDVSEFCTGSSGTCPVDAFQPSSMTCTGTSNGNPCDGVDKCDGMGNCVDNYQPSTTVCRASKGQCDEAEVCTGTSGFCPTDAFASVTTTVCRASKGQCDEAEVCTGTSGFCPTDAFASVTTTCSGTCNGNPCDGVDLCDGKGNCVDIYLPSTTGNCIDKYLPSTTVCRASKGQCDVSEFCTGKSGTCPTDAFAASSTTCTGTQSGGACDGKDLCDGKGNCVDMYLPSTTVCRASVGACDVAETCTGKESACPTDSFASATTKCSGSSTGGACDGVDYCDGKGNCEDKYLPSTTVCRLSKGQCDIAESCTGSSGACPADAFASVTTTCSGLSTGGACDGVDYCDGRGNCVDEYLPTTTVCRPSKGQCDVAESWHRQFWFLSARWICGVDQDGNCVDVYLPSTTVCRPSASDCDAPETCTGTGSQCPVDKFAPTTTKCTGTCNDNPCDGQDFCDGNGKCVDKYLPSGTVCGDTAA